MILIFLLQIDMASQLKTVFIPVAAPAVFRNLLFFKGSVFDRIQELLKSRDDLRFVFIVQKKRDYEKHLEFFKPYLGERCIYAGVDVPLAKNWRQRVFYFWYSYLVYTGTTRILATMGMRPDEPPAGGRWYLAPMKSLIANTFGRSKFIKRRVVPFLFQRIFTARPFKELYDEYQPDLIFATHLYGWFDALLLAEGARRKTASIGMPAGWDHLDKYFIPFQTDTLLVPSEQVKDMAIRFQSYDTSRIILTGYTYFDFIVDKSLLRPREEILKSLNFPADAKLIIYVSGSAYCPDEPDIIETMLKWMDSGRFGKHDVRLVIRPYAGGRTKDREFDEQKFNRFEESPRVTFYRREFWGDLEKSAYFVNLLHHADVVVSIYSTAILEAAIHDRPLMALSFDGYKVQPFHRSIRRFEEFDHFKAVLDTKAVRIARSFENLFDFTRDYLDNPGLDAEGRELLRQGVCYKLDGLSSERIFNALAAEINKC